MKRICSIILVMALSLCINVNAQTINTDYQVLESFGYPTEIIDVMAPEYQSKIAASLATSPDKVQISSGTLKVNVLEEILKFVSTPDSEYLSAGVSEEKLLSKRNEINHILTLDNESAAEWLGITLEEMNILRSYIESGTDQDVEEFLRQSPLSRAGSITEAEMDFNITVDNNSSGNSIRYDVYITFAWSKPYWTDLFNDRIAISWGGELFESNISKGNVDYYTYSRSGGVWKDFSEFGTMKLEDEESNSHLLLEFPQAINVESMAKNGTFSFRLTKNDADGEYTYIIARYGHQVIEVSGFGVTWGFPGVDFSTAFEQTDIETGRIKIRY